MEMAPQPKEDIMTDTTKHVILPLLDIDGHVLLNGDQVRTIHYGVCIVYDVMTPDPQDLLPKRFGRSVRLKTSKGALIDTTIMLEQVRLVPQVDPMEENMRTTTQRYGV